MDYMSGKLEDKSYDQAALEAALAGVPQIAAE